jgi:hypothetical protein
MMWRSLNARDRRALITCCGVIAPLVLCSRGIPAMLRWQARERAEADSLVERARVARSAIDQLGRARDSLASRRKRLVALSEGVVPGNAPAVASASLAERVSDLAEEAGVVLTTVQIQFDTLGRGSFVPIRVRASVAGDLESLADFLSSIELGPPLAMLRELSISASGPAASPEQELRAEVMVEALGRNTAVQHPR